MPVLRILRIKKLIDINKRFGNVRVTSTSYSKPKSNGFDRYTEISCWYDRDCENCPMSREERSYEGECDDWGCLFDYNFDVPVWKCMLPKWVKNIIAKHCKKERNRNGEINEDI